MGCQFLLLLLAFFVSWGLTLAATDESDSSVLLSLKDAWSNTPPNWEGSDPCGDIWEGVKCSMNRVTSITLSNIGLTGQLTGDIPALSELRVLDLSYNSGMEGPLPASIGNLQKLTTLILVGCNFFGPIPDSIGSMKQLVYLSLNSNRFNGKIPNSIGQLSKLYWLDLAENQLEGTIPVSNELSYGLDSLTNAKHFHLGLNKLSGSIPPQLFNSNMELIHLLLDNNDLTGAIPSTLSLMKNLEVVRLDRNKLSGPLPSNLSNLIHVNELVLSNNGFDGAVPDLTGMNVLKYLDISNNSFNASSFPSWASSLQSLTTFTMENTSLEGEIPGAFFSLPNLQSVNLKNNALNGTLNIVSSSRNSIKVVDLTKNYISDVKLSSGADPITIILRQNPVCQESNVKEEYCAVPPSGYSYSTPSNNCNYPTCSSNQIASPNCRCSYPYTGILTFRAPSFSILDNVTLYNSLQTALLNSLSVIGVDSVALSNPAMNSAGNLRMSLQVFPAAEEKFNRTQVILMGFMLSNQTFKPPSSFGPFYFLGGPYTAFNVESSKKTNLAIIVGGVVGGLVLLLILAGASVLYRKKRVERTTTINDSTGAWSSIKSSTGAPQLKGARHFSFEEIRKYTNNFSDANFIGSGGFGMVYKGFVPDGNLVAIKRAQRGSMQGEVEFKTEIELLSRVHHKNLVSLLGFCFEQEEQMLVYEFIANDSLNNTLSGSTGIQLDWVRRLKIALGAARGLAYMHELANPPIIHRDVKSSNILLDQQLNAKVADFGLSKTIDDKDHVTTQVKGTMGYLDPEYYMTQQLTEKSDVYSFGVVMLELITGNKPFVRGKYIVTEIKKAVDRTKDLYNLHGFLDTKLSLETLKGLDKFVDLALNCVQELGIHRPTMSKVVKELEDILDLFDGVHLNSDSASTSATFEPNESGNVKKLYQYESFDYSGSIPSLNIVPK